MQLFQHICLIMKLEPNKVFDNNKINILVVNQDPKIILNEITKITLF